MPQGKRVKYKNATPYFVVTDDGRGVEEDLEIEYYEQKGYQPPWRTLPREDI